MKKKTVITVALLVISILQGWTKEKFVQERFVNMLNLEVGNKFDPNGYFFSDLGDWHGYGFNNSSILEKAGGFRGPAFTAGRSTGLKWLSDNFEKLTLTEQQEGTQKEISYTKIVSSEYLPGMLRQQLEAGDLSVRLREIAVSDRSTMI